jgi:hypothetical protein
MPTLPHRLALALLVSAAPAIAVAAPFSTPDTTRGGASVVTRDAVVWPHAMGARAGRTLPAERPRFDPRRSCATPADGAASLIRAHAARAAITPLPSPHSADIGDIAVLEDDGTFFYTLGSGQSKVDLQEVARAFYRSHGDDYDQIAVFLASGLTDWLGSESAFAASYGVKSAVSGIGLPPADESAGMGSAGRLGAILSMNGLHRYVDDPNQIITTLGLNLTGLQTIGHEFEHQWGAYVAVESLGVATHDLLGRDLAHWNFFFDSDASVLEGCDWVAVTPDSFVTDEVEDRYGRLDQYLMGLRKPAEVGPLLLVTNPTNIQPPGNYEPKSIPFVGASCDAAPRWMTIDDVIAANGPRVPAAPDTVPTFRLAFVLAVPRGAGASASDLARLDTLRSRFVPWFETATEGRGRVDTRLSPAPPIVVIDHTPLASTEDTGSPRTIGAHVRVLGGKPAAALDPSGVIAHWRPVGAASFNAIPMRPAGADSFTASLPPFAGDAEYTLSAATLTATGSTTLPSAPGATFRYHAGPDLTPPVVTHVPVPAQAPWRLPQTLLARATDDLGVDSVWVEYAVNGGVPQTVAATHAGADSFAVALGGGQPRGARIAYRFVARDASVAHNLGYSNPAYDTLVVTRDAFEDFDDGEPLPHNSPIYSFRDAWHPETDPTEPGRNTSMHCGDGFGGVYAPHLDATLYTPWLYGIPAGALLIFDHRWDLENADAWYAYDAALLEYSTDGSNWTELTPRSGYTHQLASRVSVVPAFTPVWSGNSGGWRTDVVDLASLGPGPAIVRWRMVTDEFVGRDGWWVDHVRLLWPDGTMSVPLGGPTAALRVWPNPARGALSLTLPSGLAGDGAWELYDVAGRRVATLWRGRFDAASDAPLSVAIPERVSAGLYFSRLSAGSRVVVNTRIAVVR